MEIAIDIDAPLSLPAQLARRIKEAVLGDRDCPGDGLPSIRQLASDLGIDHRAVAEAYRLLERDAVIRQTLRGARIDERALPRLDLERENGRKSRDLAEARALQHALLPRQVPEHPDLEIAARMITATEVGGDYYDFECDDEGGLTIAVGDAVGHGARAGALVAATKGMFSMDRSGHDVAARLRRFDEAFRRMRMRRASVALLLARFRDLRLEVASAGMPRPLLHRRSSGRVEELPVTGMPLGSRLDTARRAFSVDFQQGDTLLLMSDGFPELVCESGEPFGYVRAQAAFSEIAGAPAYEVVRHLETSVRRSAGDEPSDDVTFVVARHLPTRAE